MLFYKAQVKFECENADEEKIVEQIRRMQNRSFRDAHKAGYFIYNGDFEKNLLYLGLFFKQESSNLKEASNYALGEIKNELKELSHLSYIDNSIEEICGCDVGELLDNSFDYVDRYVRNSIESNFNVECFDYGIKQSLLPKDSLTFDEAVKRANELMADASFIEELERIYSPKNKKKYYGIPVHYILKVGSVEYANELIKILISALYTNNRLLSTRQTYIKDIENDSYGRRLHQSVDDLVESSYGLATIFNVPAITNMNSNAIRRMAFDVDDMVDVVKCYYESSLFIFIQTEENDFSKKLLAQISNDVDLIEIKDSVCDKGNAIELLKLLMDRNDVKYRKADLKLPKQDSYTTKDVSQRLIEIKKNSVKNYAYRAYKDCKPVVVDKEESYCNHFDELQKMIGLENVKSLVTQIIDTYRINNEREKLGLDVTNTAKNMIFTGNPGSAKTTVARLLTSILYDEGIISNRRIVECGRQDLVGRYVGWTAKAVEEKFREARKGVLFIDEAYSLVDDSNSFGDEAINTIVQLMENYRDSVIVIFAGYPDKMKAFLDKNEGLRSRIAFHIDFPDYNAAELFEIMKLMTEQKGYVVTSSATDKCMSIFEAACTQDEFGNGRFARNVLEQAIMKQSARLSTDMRNKKLSIDDYKTLNADDFDVNAAEMYAKPKKSSIGFAS